MSAEVLRQAATLMRDRAEAARAASADPLRPDGGGWVAKPHGSRRNCTTVQTRGEKYLAHYVPDAVAHHVAGMEPSVALAVADVLDRAAADHDETPCPAVDAALVVARAYLGEAS